LVKDEGKRLVEEQWKNEEERWRLVEKQINLCFEFDEKSHQ